GHHYYSAPHSF
nr:immunoglobulin light chain junction region [Macaca mulatta]